TSLKLSDLQKSGRDLPFMNGSPSENPSSANSGQNTPDPSSSTGSESTSSQPSAGDTSSQAGGGSISSKGQKAFSFLMKTMNFIGSFLLVFIYIFFLLTYRKRFKEFLLRLFPSQRSGEVKQIIHKSATVTQQYLIGKL